MKKVKEKALAAGIVDAKTLSGYLNRIGVSRLLFLDGRSHDFRPGTGEIIVKLVQIKRIPNGIGKHKTVRR